MRQLMEEIDSPYLRADWVFTPIPGWNSTMQDAVDFLPVAPDPRARVWYDATLSLALGMNEHGSGQHLWDAFLIYEPGRTWGDGGEDNPGAPDYIELVIANQPPQAYDDFKQAILDRLPDCE